MYTVVYSREYPSAPQPLQLNPRVVGVLHAARHRITLQERQRCSRLGRDRRLKGWRGRNRRRSQ